MSLHLPSRQVSRSGANAVAHALRPSFKSQTSVIVSRRQCRHLNNSSDSPDARAAELLKDHKPLAQQVPKQGQLAEDSIFGPEKNLEGDGRPIQSIASAEGDPRAKSFALDSKPWARARWQRKKVIQEIQHRGRISRTEQILKQERYHLHGSDFFKTSIKKAMPIARQIAGKSIEEALVQLRFSKKLAARRIEAELKTARNEAIVSKGMGLGHVKSENEVSDDAPEKVALKDKNGKTRMVQPTAIYIDQAWVNKTKYNQSPEFRARGRINTLKHPHTSISFLLKEEKTRLRIAKDKEDKKAKEGPWLHHPDRKITAQRQHIMW